MIKTYKSGQQTALYEVLDEIHATDYTTYVDTGVYTSSNISIEVKWKCNPDHIPQHGKNDRIIASTIPWNDRNTMAFDFEETPHLKWKFIGDTSWSYNNSITPDSNEHICKLSATEFVYDGNVLATHSQTSIGTTSAQLRIAQSDAYQPAGEQGYYYYYYVKIWDGVTLVRNYVPAKRMSDNVYGFYDTVNSTFNPSAGDKGFTGISKSTPEYIYDTVSGNNYVNDILLHKQGVLVHKYEVLDYVSCTQSQYFDTDIYAQTGISVEMTCKMTNRPGNTRLFSTHDPVDFSGQNWAFAIGCWGLQFEGNTMCIKMLGNNNDISSFAMTSVNYSSVSGHKYLYDLSCDGILNIYEPSDNSLWYTFECTAGTDPTKVSQTTIRMFGREAAEQSEWFYGDVYDVKIKNNGTTIRHYIPVKRLSDNAIGFYDADNNEFYQSLTSTQFSGTAKSTPEYIDEITTQTIHINRIYHNGQVYWGGEITQQAIYEVLDEIHATSNPAYILTDYSPVQDTIIEVKYKVNGNYVNNHNERIFSTYPSAWNDACTVDANYSSQGLSVKFPNPPSSSGWFNNLATRDTTSSHILRVAMNECYYDGTLVATGNGTFEPSSNSIIIESVATQSSNDQGYYNLYYFNIYENNTTVRQYVPVRRISDDEIGFYDYVNQDFIAVNGTFAYTSKSIPEYIY